MREGKNAMKSAFFEAERCFSISSRQLYFRMSALQASDVSRAWSETLECGLAMLVSWRFAYELCFLKALKSKS